jgi:hypothetical protein
VGEFSRGYLDLQASIMSTRLRVLKQGRVSASPSSSTASIMSTRLRVLKPLDGLAGLFERVASIMSTRLRVLKPCGPRGSQCARRASIMPTRLRILKPTASERWDRSSCGLPPVNRESYKREAAAKAQASGNVNQAVHELEFSAKMPRSCVKQHSAPLGVETASLKELSTRV